jgi:hypothetical protein
MDKSGAGAGFLRELRFPLPIYIPSASPQSSSLSPEAGTIVQEWPQCQKPHKPNNKKNYPYINLFSLRCFLFKLVGWEIGYCTHYGPIVPAPNDGWGWLWRNWWNEDWKRKPKYSEETCPSATLSTANPTRLDPVLNPFRRCGKPATNRLSYGAASPSWSLTSDIPVLLLYFLFINLRVRDK